MKAYLGGFSVEGDEWCRETESLRKSAHGGESLCIVKMVARGSEEVRWRTAGHWGGGIWQSESGCVCP